MFFVLTFGGGYVTMYALLKRQNTSRNGRNTMLFGRKGTKKIEMSESVSLAVELAWRRMRKKYPDALVLNTKIEPRAVLQGFDSGRFYESKSDQPDLPPDKWQYRTVVVKFDIDTKGHLDVFTASSWMFNRVGFWEVTNRPPGRLVLEKDIRYLD
jgi:hypothetical protein